MIRQIKLLTTLLLFVLTTSAVAQSIVAYQFYFDKTTPSVQGWEPYLYYGSEELQRNGLLITADSFEKDGCTYQKSIGFTAYYNFHVRLKFRLLTQEFAPEATEEYLFVLAVANGTKDHGRFIRLGAVLDGAATKLGFIDQEGSFFGDTYTTPSTELLDIELVKATGTGAEIQLHVDGIATDVKVAANSTVFQVLANQNFRYLKFGFIGGAAKGSALVVGCTAGHQEDAPPINYPPRGTLLHLQ